MRWRSSVCLRRTRPRPRQLCVLRYSLRARPLEDASAASSEQSTGVAQVGEAITQMDQATQQNAALVEESAAAADSLKQQAAGLVHTVSVFRLGGTRLLA